jgi:peptide/nickel transport system substrate-binding protein
MGGALFGARFELEEQLGSGGMARVHRARDTRLGRTVALKMLRSELAREAEARTRFAREARAAAALNHPGIVTVHDQDEAEDEEGVVPYLVMEYIDGSTLEDLARSDAPLAADRAVRITCDVLDALGHAHSRGTVHRDVKPSNVMLTRAGAVKVADFGIARVAESVATRLTGTGFTIGTPGYMSPEQVLGRLVDARGDLYAVGCLLTELLTGRVPFPGGEPLNIMYKHVHQAPPRPSERNPAVPPELDEVVLKALAKNPDDRHQDAAAMAAGLRAWLEGRARDGGGAGRPYPGGRTDRADRVQPAGRSDPDVRTDADGPELAAREPDVPQAPVAQQAVGPADPRTAFFFVKDVAAPQPAEQPPLGAPPAVQPYAHPALLNPPAPAGYSFAPPPNSPAAGLPSSGLPPSGPPSAGAPPSGLPPSGSPSSGPASSGVPSAGPRPERAARRWAIAAVAAGVVGALTAATLVLHPFDRGKPGAGGRNTVNVISERKTAKGYNGALTGAVNPSKKKGGTLRLASAYPPDSLDPARSYTNMAWNLQRIYLRKLVDYAAAPGAAGTRLKPDLATTTGRITDGGKTYTYTLKEHIRFEDGSPITAQDVKYGIERSFDRGLYGTGPDHLVQLLDQGQHYPGPYDDSDPEKLGLKSVATPDSHTIVFHLEQPFRDFPYVLAMSDAAPVPKDKDTKEDYEKRPVASGPYKLAASYDKDTDKSLRLVRNSQWDPATDPIHTALPDSIELTFPTGGQDAVDEGLLHGRVDLDAAQVGVGEAAQTQIENSDRLRARADAAYTGGVRYFSLQTNIAPLDDFHCRRAVQYAIDKPAMRAALGGEPRGGDVASGMLPPTVAGYDGNLDPYGTGHGPQVQEAKRELEECGKAKGFSVKLVATNSTPVNEELLQILQKNLAAVHIRATVDSVPAAGYYTDLGKPATVKKRGWGIALVAWASDWPAPGGFLRPLVDDDSVYNYAGLHDWEITGLMDDAEKEKGAHKAEDTWKTVDEKVMDEACLLPFLFDRQLNYRGPRLTNAYIQPALGGIDLQALGVE